MQNEPRSKLMRVLRESPAPVLLGGLLGGLLMAVSCGIPEAEGKLIVWHAGCGLLALAGVLFCTILWGGVYLQVVEASRGMPGLRVTGEPDLQEEAKAAWEALRQGLTG